MRVAIKKSECPARAKHGGDSIPGRVTPRPKRPLVRGIACPRCGAEAIYRYGRSATGKRRYLCQVCRRQFCERDPGRLPAEERPACPACGGTMHVYMRRAGVLRFRCAAYPGCRTFFKQPMKGT